MEKPLQTLHRSLLQNNYDVPEDYESFEKTLTAKGDEGVQNRVTLWKALRDNNYDVPDNYESFSATLFAPVKQSAPATKPKSTSDKGIFGNLHSQIDSKMQQAREAVKQAKETKAPYAGETVNAEDGYTFTEEGLDSLENGATPVYQPSKGPKKNPAGSIPMSPMSAEASMDPVHGTSRNIGSQVHNTEGPDGVGYNAPFRKDLTAAQHDEIVRRNNYAVRQAGKLSQEYEKEEKRRNQPLVDTGNEQANKHVVKTQGKWEEELDKGVRELGSKYVAPMVDKAIEATDAKYSSIMSTAPQQTLGAPTGMAAMAAVKMANQAVDPDKVLQGLQESLKKAYSSPEMQADIEKRANAAGIPVEEYIEKVVAPTLSNELAGRFAESQIAKYLPKNSTDYVLQGVSNSILGMLIDAATETKGQRYYKNQAEAMTEEGNNQFYQPGKGAKLTKMGVSFAADAPFFGLYGKVSGEVAKKVAERQIQNLISKGLSEGAARSIVGTALENSVGQRMKNYLMQHVISSSLTMGQYNLSSEAASQMRDKEGVDLARLADSTVEGLAIGGAFGVTGGISQALSQPLTGFAKVGAKVAGFGTEAETMYATEELAKMANGEEGFENPFEGSVEALMKLGVMKVSSPEGLKKVAEGIFSPTKLVGRQRTGISFSEEEQNYIRNSAEGQSLIDAISKMHPETSISEVNGKKQLTKEGEALRQQLSDRYDDFMSNKEIPATVKQKVAGVLGGIYRPGLEVEADIIQNEDGTAAVKTRDKDGNLIRDIKFDSYGEAQERVNSFASQVKRNDAVNMWNNATNEQRAAIVQEVRDIISGQKKIDEMVANANGMVQNRLRRELEKINKEKLQSEGRELTEEEAVNYIQTVIRDGGDEVFNDLYQTIHDKAVPADELNTKRNYWEGTQVTPEQRHQALLEAERAEDALYMMDGDFAAEVIGAADYPDEKMADLAGREDITGKQLQAAMRYYNAVSKAYGMMDEALKDVDQQVEAANAVVRRNTHSGSGQFIEVEFEGQRYYLTAGDANINPDGTMNVEKSGDAMIVRNAETGEIEVVTPDKIRVTAINDPARIIAENESNEGLRGQLMKQTQDNIELNPKTPAEPQPGDMFLDAEGKPHMAVQMQDGSWSKIALDENGEPQGEPMPLDVNEWRKAKSVEIDEMYAPKEENAGESLENAGEINGENGKNSVENGNLQGGVDNAGGEAGTEGAGGNNPSAAALSKIPVDEKGKPQYEKATPEDTMAELTAKHGPERAAQMVAQMAANTAKKLEELQKKDVSDITDMDELDAYYREVGEMQQKHDYWQSILDSQQKPNTETVFEVPKEEKPASDGRAENIGRSDEGDGARVEAAPSSEAKTQAPVEPEKPAEPAKPETPAKPEKPAEANTAEQKVAQGTIKNNIGKRFEFKNQDGTHSEVVVNSFKGDDMVTVTRQDYDAQGNAIGEPYAQDLNMVDVSNSIINKFMKPVKSIEERLRDTYKYKVGDVPLLDVLTEDEQRQVLDAINKGDKEALGQMTGDLIDSHREDIILRGQEIRNEKVSRIMEGTASREEKLRRVRKEYQGLDEALSFLEDESLYPSSAEDWVVELHSRVPKSGNGKLAYFSYDQDGKEVVGMKDETGYGTKTGGDTKGFAPWLAPEGKGMSLQQYAEQIHSQIPESEQQKYTDQDFRNAILEVFGAAERPSDIPLMTIKRGILQAEQAAKKMEEMWMDDAASFQKVPRSFASRLKRAIEMTSTEPSDKQKEAGNYPKGHISFGGYDYSIENPAGSMRRGVDGDGKAWEQKMHNTYGYILRKYGKDGDHLDMFINDAADLDNWDGKVYVVDQVNPKTGEFDEHKVMYGFDSEAEASDAYLSNYEKGWQGLGKITGVDKATFDKWLDSSDRKIKEFAEHSIIKNASKDEKPAAVKPHSEIDNALRDELYKPMRENGIEVITDERGQKMMDNYSSETKTERGDVSPDDFIRPQKVESKDLLKQLESGPTVKRYRAMQLIDGKLYPPMSAKVDGEMRQPTEIGVWEQAEERPDLVKNGKFVLRKGQKGQSDVPAAYNPYFHTSTSGLNDQFTSAHRRPELVVVEVEIPESELTSGYKAEGAKDAVGDTPWHSGPVNGKLPADRKRTVTLSRYSKVTRIVPDSEVAEMIAKQLEGTGVEVPYNVVTPALRKELEARGVKVSEQPSGSVGKQVKEQKVGKQPKFQKVSKEPFYSNAAKAVEGIKQEKATPEQWLKMIEKAGGLKAGEDKWMGLSDWLKEQQEAGKKTLTKQEVEDFIRKNQIEIEEVSYIEGMSKEAEDKLDALNEEFMDYISEGEIETGSIYASDWVDYAYKKMVEQYGDDFDMAFDIEGQGTNSRLTPAMDWNDQMSGAAKYFLGMDTNSGRPIHGTRLDYTTEGLENKKEIALTVPTIEPYNESDEIHFGDAGEGRAVAWVRFGETTDADGKRVLVIDEIQSKRHQDARELGYQGEFEKSPKKQYEVAYDKLQEYRQDLEKKYGEYFVEDQLTDEERAKYNEMYKEVVALSEYKDEKVYTVPDAPFEKNWHELAMKRMLRYAAENGYDKIAWTTGEQQADRYDIGNALEEIYTDVPENSEDKRRFIAVTGKDRQLYTMRVNSDGSLSSSSSMFDGQNINDVFGKELSNRILNAERKTRIKDEGLRIGGEGMKGFYDQMLPRFMDKYGKKWGVKTGEIDLPEIGQTMHAVDVTPEMKESVMQGQPMFFKTPDGEAYGYTLHGKIYIDPKIATSETPIHEYGHLWAAMKRQTSPEEWNQIKSVLMNDKLVQPFIDKVKEEYPELVGKDDDFVEEVLTQFSGKRGAERLRVIAAEIERENGGDMTAKTIAEVAVRKMKGILDKFWRGVAEMMGWKYTNAEEIADRVLYDLLSGKNPNEEIKKARANRADELKQRQLDIILKENPADDENIPGHTWIRSAEDINTFREALEYDGYGADEDITPDFTADMVKDALEKGVVTVYSSNPIKDGAFVTPSKMEAKNYAGDGKVYSKEVPLTDVAWIDATQGQYARVSDQVKSQKMDYASDEEKKRTEAIFNAAKKLFGTTYDIREAGYILPDGTMPDFSGRHLMNPGSDTSFLRGRRTTDHREIQSIAYEKDGNTKTGIETDMPDFIRRGAIRIDDAAGNINLATKPTDKQKEALRRMIARNDGYVQVDFGDGWDSDHYVEYDGAKPAKVLADIDRYFDEGIKPESGPKFQLVGKKGAEKADEAEGTTMRQDNMKVAEEMEKAGKDDKTIKIATGWERGKDGKWRYETVDADVDVLTPYEKKLQEMKDEGVENPMPILKLQELLGKDNELFKYYPQMRNVQVMFDPTVESGIAGSTDGKTIELNANETSRFGDKKLDNENVYGTLLHEVQHVIQEKEGFAQGGSLSTATTEAGMEAIMHKKEMERDRVLQEIKNDEKILNSGDELKDYASLDGRTVEDERQHLKERLDELAAEYDNLTAQIDRIYKMKTVSMSDARDLYHNLAGEVEARNVNERMGMSEMERRYSPSSSTEDVARRDQVVIKGDGGQSMSEKQRFVEEMNDDEKAAVRKRLEETKALPATEGTIVKREDKSARNVAMEWADKHIPEAKTVSTEIGDLVINKKSISDSLAHGFSQAKLDAIPTLLPAFEEGRAVYIGSGKDVNGNPIIDHYFAYPIDYKGNREYVFCRTREDQNTHRLYIHEVITGEDIKNGQTLQSTAPEKPRTGLPLYRNIMSDVFGSKDTKKTDTIQENLQENAEILREGEAQTVSIRGEKKMTPKQKRERQAFAERQWRRAHDDAADTVKKLNLGDNVTIVDSIEELEGYESFSDRKKRAKGWYDQKTGKIVVVMGNHRSPVDVVKTILHEGVSHHGLRKLFGEHFDTFLDNVYSSAESRIKNEIDKLSKKYNDDVRKGTEEYLARLAEDTDFEGAEKRTWVQHWFNQIKQAFLNMLKEIGLPGYDQYLQELTDNELRYILWRSYKNLSEPGKYRNVFSGEGVAKEVKIPVKRNVEDEIPKMIRDHSDEISIEKKVAEMSMDEVEAAYKRLDDMMRDKNGLDIDEQEEARRQEYIKKNGRKGLGKYMADFLQQNMDKYGSAMITLRWELQDRLFGAGKYAVKEGDELYRDDEESPASELTPEERQYWKEWDTDMKKWKARHGLSEDAERPKEAPKMETGESALQYASRLVQHNRQKALWNTAPKIEDYRQKREDKDILESAREEERQLPNSPRAKMRRVAAELAKIRHAMAQQKAYDKATVKAVTDFANDFMKMGFGDNLSRGEIERMLSSVKNATGAKNIKKEVDNVLNILIDNHLRNLDQAVQKLSSVKELKLTAQGVEAQGKLELKGQRMIQAFREARETRMTADKIRERMNEVAEKMARDDDEAPMWEQEYEGLGVALQYAEDIEGSREEWADLNREYKDAVADYKTSGRSYQAQQELLESIEQAMLENKIERVGLFGGVIGRLQGDIAESVQGAREFVEREKERVRHINDIANADLSGKDWSAMRTPTKLSRLANSTGVRFFLGSLGTFEQMLKQFGSRNAKGEGALYDYFMGNWMDSVDNAYLGEKKAKEELDAKAHEVFGDEVKRWSDLYKLTNKEGAKVTVLDQGIPKDLILSQGNLLYIYMANKMNDGAMKLRKMGITDEKVEEIKKSLDQRLVELADWLQDEYMVNRRVEYNKVHERMFGAPMAAIDHYFPIKILGDARIQEQDVANMADQDAVLPSTITGSIIKRRRNALPLDILNTDAMSLALEHIEDMERWAAQVEWNRDVNTLLSNTTFRNKVKNMTTIYGSGDQLWNNFADAARIAAGTYRPKVKPGSVDKTISNIAKGVTAAKINFRVYTAFKQLLSAPAFLHDVNLVDFAKYSVNPYGSWKWAMENMPVFEKRWKSRQVGDTRLMDDPTDWKMWKTNIVQMATRMGMSPNALVDAVTCAVGARAIYESRYKKYKSIGASDEVANKQALRDAKIGYNLTQQSSEGAFVSAIQKDKTVAANMLSVFRNSSMAYTRQWVDAARNLEKRLHKGYKEDSINFMARQFQEKFDLEPEQARKASETEYAKAGRHEIAKMLNMMFGVTVAWNLGASLPYLLFGDDDNTKKEMMEDALIRGLVAGPTEGLVSGNLYSEFVSRSIASEETRKAYREGGFGAAFDTGLKQGGDYEVNPLPLMADIQNMIKKLGYDKYAAAQDVFNICMQSAVGVNPQTFTDMWNACMDYGAPGWDGTSYTFDAENMTRPKEIALFIMRLMNAPTSSWRNKYIDELGMTVEDGKKLSYDEMAKRYAHYKHWKDAPMMGWLRGEEGRQEKMDKIRKQFDKEVQKRMNRLDYEYLREELDNTEDEGQKKTIVKAMKEQTKALDNKELLKQQSSATSQDERKMLNDAIRDRAKNDVTKISDEALADSIKNTSSVDRKNAFASVYAKRQGAQDYYGRSNSPEAYKRIRGYEDIKEDIMIADLFKQNKDKLDKKTLKKVNKLRSKVSNQRSKLGDDPEVNAEMMKDLRDWRKEAIELLMKAEDSKKE